MLQQQHAAIKGNQLLARSFLHMSVTTRDRPRIRSNRRRLKLIQNSQDIAPAPAYVRVRMNGLVSAIENSVVHGDITRFQWLLRCLSQLNFSCTSSYLATSLSHLVHVASNRACQTGPENGTGKMKQRSQRRLSRYRSTNLYKSVDNRDTPLIKQYKEIRSVAMSTSVPIGSRDFSFKGSLCHEQVSLQPVVGTGSLRRKKTDLALIAAIKHLLYPFALAGDIRNVLSITFLAAAAHIPISDAIHRIIFETLLRTDLSNPSSKHVHISPRGLVHVRPLLGNHSWKGLSSTLYKLQQGKQESGKLTTSSCRSSAADLSCRRDIYADQQSNSNILSENSSGYNYNHASDTIKTQRYVPPKHSNPREAVPGSSRHNSQQDLPHQKDSCPHHRSGDQQHDSAKEPTKFNVKASNFNKKSKCNTKFVDRFKFEVGEGDVWLGEITAEDFEERHIYNTKIMQQKRLKERCLRRQFTYCNEKAASLASRSCNDPMLFRRQESQPTNIKHQQQLPVEKRSQKISSHNESDADGDGSGDHFDHEDMDDNSFTAFHDFVYYGCPETWRVDEDSSQVYHLLEKHYPRYSTLRLSTLLSTMKTIAPYTYKAFRRDINVAFLSEGIQQCSKVDAGSFNSLDESQVEEMPDTLQRCLDTLAGEGNYKTTHLVLDAMFQNNKKISHAALTSLLRAYVIADLNNTSRI